MKIGPSTDLVSSNQELPTKDRVRGSPVSGDLAVPATDQVNFSAASVQINGSQSPSTDFDGAKVDAIKEAIRRGEFKVDSGVIADRLIAEASALLRPRSH